MDGRGTEAKQAWRKKWERARKTERRGREELHIASWNVNSFAQRAKDVDALFASETLDVLFVCETLQRRLRGLNLPLHFEGEVTAMPAVRKSKRGRPSMGIAFLSKTKGLLKRVSARQGEHWQILEVSHPQVRLAGVYATPQASKKDWQDIADALTIIRARGGKLVVCGDLNASHPSWSPCGKTTGGKAVLALTTPLQRREPRAADAADTPRTKRLTKERGRLQRGALFALRAPTEATHQYIDKNGKLAGSVIDLMLVSGWKGCPPPRPKVLASPAACASDHLPISVRLDLRIPIEKAKSVFLPTPRRMESVVADEARQLYSAELPGLASLLRAAGTRLAFHAHA